MDDLVLIHGGNGSPSDFDVIKPHLERFSRVHLYTRLGHGGRRVVGDDERNVFISDFTEFLAERQLGRVAIFGYSFGADSALRYAHAHPERIIAVIALGGVYFYDGATMAKLRAATDTAQLERFADRLAAKHHPQDWREVIGSNRRRLERLGVEGSLRPADYQSLRTPTLVISGDNDDMSALSDARRLAALLPRSRLRRFVGTAHPMKKAPFVTIAKEIEGLLREARLRSSSAPAQTRQQKAEPQV